MTINLSALQKQRRDSAANWTAENPTLLAGEIGIESDTGYWKVGDGSTAWTSLAYVSGLGAEIPVDRLADGTAGQIIQTDSAGTGVEWSSTANLPLGSASAPAYRFQGDANTGIYSPGADQVAISTNGTGRLFVDASGRVGVGATPQAAKLSSTTSDVGGTIGDTAQIVAVNANGAVGDFAGIRFNYFNDGNSGGKFAYIGSVLTSTATNGAADIVFGTRPTSTTTISERMRLDSSGRLGLGTSSPGQLLHVANGSAWVGAPTSSSSGTVAIYGDGNNGSIEVFAGNSTSTKRNLLLCPYGGAVGIGTTAPGATLHVQSALPQVFLSNSQSTAADKFALVCGLQRANDTEPEGFSIIGSQSTPTDNVVHIGGFFSEANAATAQIFYTAANNTTRSGSERARIDNSGRLLVGTSSGRSQAGYTPTIQLEGTSASAAYGVVRSSDNSGGPVIGLAKARGSSVGSNTAVIANDNLGSITFAGANGTDLSNTAASIDVYVDGTPFSSGDTTDLPGRLVFSTTADGASSPTERMRIKNNGIINFSNVPTYADNAAATTGGLVAGDVYRTSTGQLMIRY